jgi:hypothetical protein
MPCRSTKQEDECKNGSLVSSANLIAIGASFARCSCPAEAQSRKTNVRMGASSLLQPWSLMGHLLRAALALQGDKFDISTSIACIVCNCDRYLGTPCMLLIKREQNKECLQSLYLFAISVC